MPRNSVAEPKVSMASVQEGAPKMKAYGGKAAKVGSKAAHARGEEVRSAIHMAPSPKSSGFSAKPQGMSARNGQAPQATGAGSYGMGSMGIIQSPSQGGRERSVGIPGIISSTSLGPEQRSRLVSGIIESPMAASAVDGPVHKIMGNDATAYNEGMVHLRGSSFK